MRRNLSLIEVLLIGIVVLLLFVAASLVLTDGQPHLAVLCAVAAAAVVLFMLRYSNSPDRLRARQSERTLRLAAKTLPFMRQGLTLESAEEVCKLLLPATMANAVAITDRTHIMGFAGIEREYYPLGSPIKTKATMSVLADGQVRVITSQEDIGFPRSDSSLQAAIIVPLILHEEPVGVLKFYYRSPKKIDETQRAMAQGLAALLEMQLQLADLEHQRELATQMRLKALQAQINPHFLFNTINTIASLIRTNPAQARILLREFAVFYRQTLEGSLDRITLEQEHLQTLRYFGFEVARFGEERLSMDGSFEPGLAELLVPSFVLQPLVENAVAHGMRDDRPLRIEVRGFIKDGVVCVAVSDDGMGMSSEELKRMLDPKREHASVALRNVDERLRGFFGASAGLAVQSELGVGTTVVLTFGEFDQLKVVEDAKSDNR
ncbi:MAG: histidine kinase [Coriobacteriales bacterium]|jgi:two-component system sensor histidine kinase LytS|nr:histidine kinase [Coriobacteriales bacterium]